MPEGEMVCSREEARELLDDLKTAWGELSHAERWELRGALRQVGDRERVNAV